MEPLIASENPYGHGVEGEPHFTGGDAGSNATDESEQAASRTLCREATRGGSDREQALQSVVEEPHLVSRLGVGTAQCQMEHCCPRCGYDRRSLRVNQPCPKCGHLLLVGYTEWLRQAQFGVTAGWSWLLIVLVVLTGGVWAVLGAILSSAAGASGAVVFGPVVEEIMKVALILVLIETRPYLLHGPLQIWVSALASAASFAVIENLLYLNVYTEAPSMMLVVWRWLVCTSLHLGCTSIATLGVVRTWQDAMARQRPSQVSVAFPWLVIAMIVHGTYNAFALALALSGFVF